VWDVWGGERGETKMSCGWEYACICEKGGSGVEFTWYEDIIFLVELLAGSQVESWHEINLTI
jgi:hypothetical protein